MVTLRLERHMGRVECVMCQVPVRKVRGGGRKGDEGGEVEEEVEVRRVGGWMRGAGIGGAIVVDEGVDGEVVGSLLEIVDGWLWRRTPKVRAVSRSG